MIRLATSLAVLLLAALSGAPTGPGGEPAAVVGLDHVPIAVADLEAAAERYRALSAS